MVKGNKTNIMFTYETGLKQGRLDQKQADIQSIEEFSKHFHIDPLIINRLILKIKSGEV